MSDLRAELLAPLPERLAIGRGAALLVRGRAACDEPIEELSVAFGEYERPALVHGVRERGAARQGGGHWSALVLLGGVERPTNVAVEVWAALSGGRQVCAEVGQVTLAPEQPLADEGTTAMSHREQVAKAARSARQRFDGQTPIAIAMATFKPALEPFQLQLESIRHQTHQNWICVICDDGSPAAWLEAMRTIIGDDRRFVLLPAEANRGMYRNFERALSLASHAADFVALADQADFWYPHKLETLLSGLGSDATLAYGDMRLVSGAGEVLTDKWCAHVARPTLESLLISRVVPGSASLIRREVLDYALPFPPEEGSQRHDQWLALVALCLGELRFEKETLSVRAIEDASAVPELGAWTQPDGGRRARLHQTYFNEHCRMLVTAGTLRMRFGSALDAGKLATLDAVIARDVAPRLPRIWLRAWRLRLRRGPRARQERLLLKAISRRRIWALRGRARARLARALRWLPGRQRQRLPEAEQETVVPGGEREATRPRDAGPSSLMALQDETDWSASSPAHPGPLALSRDGISSSASLTGHPLAIDVRGVSKGFRMPVHRPETLKERIMRPGRRIHPEPFLALDDITFSVRRGEFFGIAGRNGSGKSTLLQVLAGIYRADRGTVDIAHRVAPLFTLGVGFKPDLPARENVILSAQLMGRSAEEARERFDEVIAFAELEDFVDLKLKNYSSGMKVRLAFSVAMMVDADVLLLDEVLAVGDAAFHAKCDKAFEQWRTDGSKTMVLVTHAMPKLQRYCDRALLLENGRVELLGDPAEVASRYAELALEAQGDEEMAPKGLARRAPAREGASIVDMWVKGADGRPTQSVRANDEILLHAVVEASEDLADPGLRLEILGRGNSRIFAPPTLDLASGNGGLGGGDRIEVETAIENKLTPGSYTLVCTVTSTRRGAERSVSRARSAEFTVPAGPTQLRGVMDLEHSVTVTGEADRR